jgi:hypothetical protein
VFPRDIVFSGIYVYIPCIKEMMMMIIIIKTTTTNTQEQKQGSTLRTKVKA